MGKRKASHTADTTEDDYKILGVINVEIILITVLIPIITDTFRVLYLNFWAGRRAVVCCVVHAPEEEQEYRKGHG